VTAPTSSNAIVVTPEGLLEHWQGHRRVTRRMIEAFPEKELFTFSIGGMRTFAVLAMEFIGMAAPTVRGISTGEWTSPERPKPETKAELLRRWDESTDEINRLWAKIPPQAFQESHNAFGQWDGTGQSLLFYVIDNEVHHRGQGYVYLRALGIEPPPFYDRS
jgi:uncharacterized damage-inducible protein DinB